MIFQTLVYTILSINKSFLFMNIHLVKHCFLFSEAPATVSDAFCSCFTNNCFVFDFNGNVFNRFPRHGFPLFCWFNLFEENLIKSLIKLNSARCHN